MVEASVTRQPVTMRVADVFLGFFNELRDPDLRLQTVLRQ